MQKATPFLMVLFLVFSATVLSVRSKDTPDPPAGPAAEVVPDPAEPAAAAPDEQAEAKTSVPAKAWPQYASDILPDKKAIFGTLDNGFRYIIYPNGEPPKRVSLRLHISSGSLMEADDQQGLAHFLEHMVFNGTKDYSADDLIPQMQRLGIQFGAHMNAYTSFDETVYMLDLPDLSDDTLKLGFTVMRNFGDGALLSDEEIDRERGVILSEKISRDSVSMRLMEQQFSKLLPNSLLSKRFPIGLDEIIAKAPRERFVDYYKRFYIPQRMTFVVVGDIDPAEMQATIEKTFSSMTNLEVPGANPDIGPIPQPEGLVTYVFADKEVASTEVSLLLIRRHDEKPDSVAKRSADMKMELADAMLNRRFERIAKMDGSPIASGSASHNELFNYMDIGSIDVTATDDRWQEAVPVLEQEFRRTIDFGFTEPELTEAKSNMLNQYEQAVKQEASRRSDGLASAIASSINDNVVFSDPETDLAIARESLDGIDLVACHEAFKQFWDAPGHNLILTTKEKPKNAETELSAIFEESRGKPVETPATRALEAFGYTSFGKPGTVTSRKEIEDLGITQLVLSNKVRVNLKPTDFEQGKIRLLARIGSGKLSQPKDSPMLDDFATAIFEGGGLGKHSNDDLAQILAGKNVGSSLSIGEDAFLLSGTTTPGDFQTQVQVMCASLTDPGYRDEALRQFHKAIPMIYQQLTHTPAGAEQEMQSWLYGGDSRFGLAPQEKLAAYTVADAKKWLTPELTKGYLELSLVGDFDIDKILPDLLATFGALPARAATAPTMADARKISFVTAPNAKTFTYESKIPQGIATAFWQTAGVRGNQKEFRRLNVVGDILANRIREEIREKLGASYSPVAGAAGSDAFDDVGYIISRSVGKPEDLHLLLQAMSDLAATFATEGATADELDRSLNPIFTQLTKSLRDNSYWLGTVMSQSQAEPQRLDLARSRDADYRTITLDEINALAKKYLTSKSAILVSIKSEN